MFDDEICDKQKAHESQSRRSDRRSNAASNFGDNDPDSDATEVQREAVAQFASLCRGSGEEFLEGSDLLPGLLARLPGWRSSGVLLEILRKGRSPVTLCFDEHDLLCRPAISLRKITDNHYRAIVDGEEVELGANGNSLFYAVWYALKDGVSTETRQQIYGDYSPSDMFGAADFFRNAIADYALSHEEEVGYKLSHTQLLATDNGKPQKEKSHSTDKQEEHADLAASWSDYVPFSLKEIARILFHSGKSLSATFGWSVLTAQGLGALNQWLPVPYLPLRIYLLYDALLNRREFFGAFLNLLSFLPYHALASDHFLFDIADAARQIYHPLLSGIEDLPPYFWTSVATLALVAHYALYARLNIDQPQTRIGQTLTRLLQQLRHVPQLYGLLETINLATPSSALDEDGNMKITPAEIRKTRLERKALKAAFLSRVASSSQPDAQSGNSPVNTNTGQQQQISTSRELVWMPAETIANTPSPVFNLSIGAESTASTLIGPRRAAESDSEYLALAALSALLDVTHELKQENAEGSHERSSSQIPDGYALSAPEATAFSAASGTDSLVTPGRATVAALYVSSPVARRAILAGVAMVAIAAVATYLVQLGLTIPGESDYDEAEILQPDAQPFSQETPGNNTEMQTSNFKWLYLKGRNLACVRHWIETQLDHEFFLDALPFIFSPENKNTDEKSEKEFYKNTVRIAGGDFIRDVNIPIRYRSSEDRYGVELYSIIQEIDPVDNCAPEKLQRLKPVLIKIKAYETFILRERRNLHFDTKEGVVAKLESVFGLPIELPEIEISTETLNDYVSTELGYKTNTTIPQEVKSGVTTAISIWTEASKKYLVEKSGIPESVISECRQTIQDKIKKEKEIIYTLRGPRDKEHREISKATLAEYRYSAHYLENLITLSHNFLKVMDEIKPSLHELKPRLSTLSRTLGDATVFFARNQAVKAALKMLGKGTPRTKSKNPDVLEDLSVINYLNNYKLLVESSKKIAAFISLAEAAFYEAIIKADFDHLHEYAGNPTVLIFNFKRELDKSPLEKSYESVAFEGSKFLQEIKTSDKTGDDYEYHRQFSTFKEKYHSSVVKALSYRSLFDYGMHPYAMLIRKPLRVVQMTLYMRSKLPPAPKVSLGYAFLQIMNAASDISGLKTTYAQGGELIFCEMSTKNWIVISTLGGSTVVRSATAKQMNQNGALRDIALEQGSPELDLDNALMEIFYDNIADGSNLWWMDEHIINLVVRPIFGNASTIDATSFEKAYLYLNSDSKRDFKDKNMLTIVNESTDHALKTLMDQAEEANYRKVWWQYYTFLFTGFDIIYRLIHDPDYEPSRGEITMEVISGLFNLIAIGIPVGQLSARAASALRASVVKNIGKGLRGPALFLAVWAEVGSVVGLFPLHVLTIAGYEIFAFWQPIPVKKVTSAIYKSVKNFKFNFKFKKISGNQIKKPAIKNLDTDPPETINPVKNEPAEAQSLVIALEPNNVRYYEYSYSYVSETPLGIGRLPEGAVAGPSATGARLPLEDPHTLNEEGAIELNTDRAITTITTPFTYSRADAMALPNAVFSRGDDGANLVFESVEQGIARDIQIHRQPLAPFAYGGDLGINPNTEIVYLRERMGSAIGIRIDLENIAPERPMLITSGDMSRGALLVGIDQQGAQVHIYRLGDLGGTAADSAVDNIAIRRVLESHNSLVTREGMAMSIPELVQRTDLLWLSQKFSRIIVIYADDPRASGFTILDKDFDLSSQLGAPLVTRHSASSPKLELVNFGHTSGDRNIIQSYGNAYYLISRKDNDQVAIVGRAEYRGNVDTENIKPWQPSAEDGKTSDIARSDLAEIEDLLVRSGKKVSSLIRIPDSDNFKAVKAAGEYLSPEGYNVRYRASIILPDEQSDEIIRHYALVVEKNDRAYVVDISAARFSKQGIENPLYLTDPAWRVQYISTFPII